VYALGGK